MFFKKVKVDQRVQYVSQDVSSVRLVSKHFFTKIYAEVMFLSITPKLTTFSSRLARRKKKEEEAKKSHGVRLNLSQF